MTSDEIRQRYLDFFAERDHRRLPSASLIPAEHDPSVLFTIAGMHPLKPYFLGQERPPHPRVTTCQKTFRTADIPNRIEPSRTAKSLSDSFTSGTSTGMPTCRHSLR